MIVTLIPLLAKRKIAKIAKKPGFAQEISTNG
jgi:hypothetical protein